MNSKDMKFVVAEFEMIRWYVYPGICTA